MAISIAANNAFEGCLKLTALNGSTASQLRTATGLPCVSAEVEESPATTPTAENGLSERDSHPSGCPSALHCEAQAPSS